MREKTLIKGIEIKKELDKSKRLLENLVRKRIEFVDGLEDRYYDVGCHKGSFTRNSVEVSMESVLLALDNEIEEVEALVAEKELELKYLVD